MPDEGNQTLLGWSEKIFFCYSDDFFKTSKNISERGNKFHLTKNYLYIAEVKNEAEQTVKLLLSKSISTNYSAAEVNLPLKRLNDYTFNILDDTDGEVLINLNHQSIQSNLGTIFRSEYNGLKFYFSLMYNIRHPDGLCEFQRVKGVRGVNIANIYDSTLIDKNVSKIPKKTLITFDNGKNWKTIKAPKKDSLGNNITCGEEICDIQLQILEKSSLGDILSSNYSSGLLIANGNVGQHLSESADDLNTFISRDAGKTWAEVKKGTHLYEIGDHGGLIIIVSNKNPTNVLYYSWDYGNNWKEYKFSNETINAKKIQSFEKHKGLTFLLEGVTSSENKPIGFYLNLFYTTKENCNGSQNPQASNSDYEIMNFEESKCVNKTQISYVMRKLGSICKNGEEFERPIITKPCDTSFSLRKIGNISVFSILFFIFLLF